MAIDRYTKTILTIIAVCLVYLSCRLTFPVSSANAQSNGPIEVKIVDVSGVSQFSPLPVKVVQ